jgi:TonB family protein
MASAPACAIPADLKPAQSIAHPSKQLAFLLPVFPLESKDMLKVYSPLRLRSLLLLLSACALVRPVHSQSSEFDLKARLMDKPLYLRGCWRDDKLHFDSTGQLKGKSDPVTFTLSGFELQTVHLKQDRLVLEGRRVGLELRDNKQKRVPLNVGKPTEPEDEPMHIEIEASSSSDYGQALDAIFANGLAELVPSVPSYWQAYASKNFIPAAPSTAPSATSGPNQQTASPHDTKPRRIGGGVKPPKLLHAKEPEFNEVARALRYSGAVLVNLWLQPDGTVSHLSLVRALGLGLDERALAAVQKYTFSPATMNDVPVLVELNVEVNFQIF